MTAFDFNVLLLLFILSITHINAAVKPFPAHDVPLLNRSSFPPDFIFGTASSAFQV